MIRRLMFLLAAIGLGWGGAAMAQTFTVSSIGAANLGNVAAAASGQTIFRAAAASGIVTKLSGNGVRLGSGTVRSLVTVACGDQGACSTANALVTITTIGSPTGRAAALQTFTVSTSGATATIVLAPGTGSSITFRIGPVGRNSSKTFWAGYDLPINGDNAAGATGNAASSFVVTASRTDGTRANSLSDAVAANVFRSLTIAKTADLNFGRISAPRSGTGTVSLASANGAVTVSGTGVSALSAVTPGAAAFTIAGEGGQSLSVSVPTTFVITGTGGSITVTTSPSHSGVQTLSGAIGAAGTIPLKIGGSFNLSTSTGLGTYTGSLSVTVQYN